MVRWRSKWLGVMFKMAAMAGLRVHNSSWKLESSCTTKSPGCIWGKSPMSGRPILPPTQLLRPATRPIWPVSEVVVVLPADPVMPITAVGVRRKNSCGSLVTQMPRARAASAKGMSAGTPGLNTNTSASSKRVIGCSPNTKSMSKPSNSTRLANKRSRGRASETTTCAPSAAANWANALPSRARPMMMIFLPVQFSIVIGNQ